VTNPGATLGPSNSALITVNNPLAGMRSVSPNKAGMKLEPNSTGLQMTINGLSFKRGAKVQVEGFAALSTTFVDSTTLIATIPADALQVGGIFKVTVSNPEPNIGSSEGQPFIVYALVPTLLSIDTGTLTFSPGPTKDTTSPIQAIVILHGSNFGKTYSAAVQSPPGDFPSCGNPPDKNPYAQLPVTRVSSTEMIATLSINCTGTYNIYVSSNQTEPGGGVSGVVSFVVNSPGTGVTPAIGSLTPPSTPVGTAFTLTINGNNFLPNALVNFGTAILKPVSVTSTAIVVNVPAYYLQEKGKIPVTVTNPGVGGTGAGQAGTSPRFFLVVN